MKGQGLTYLLLEQLEREVEAMKERHAAQLRELGAEVERARAEARQLRQENETLRAQLGGAR